MLTMPDTVKEALDLKRAELGQEAHSLDTQVTNLRETLRQTEIKKTEAYTAVSQFEQYLESMNNGNKLLSPKM